MKWKDIPVGSIVRLVESGSSWVKVSEDEAYPAYGTWSSPWYLSPTCLVRTSDVVMLGFVLHIPECYANR